MPVNSFDDYPMSFKPDKATLNPPLYLSLSHALELEIKTGKLPPNTLLPPQRELADFLDINLSTVTRAYKTCQLKGIIYTLKGKGSFVSPNAQFASDQLFENIFSNKNTHIELGVMKPFYSLDNITLETARMVINSPKAVQLFRYSTSGGEERHIQAAKVLMERYHLYPNSELITFACGSQNAINIVLTALFGYRDRIAVDEYTYPSFIAIANTLNIQLVPVKNDEFGMKPDELDKLCRINKIKGIYLMPSCSNPISILMPMERRYALAEMIKKYNLILLEDDAYTFLAPANFLPFASFLPEHTVHICSISKSISAGLRVAYITYSEKFRSKIISTTYNLNINTPLLNLEIVSELVLNGNYITLINKKIELSQRRNQIFQKYFQPYSNHSNPLSLFQCIKLSKNCSSKVYAAKSRSKGINVISSDIFIVGDISENPFIRLSICSPDSEADLEYALQMLTSIIPKNIREAL
jgi:Transcriptional regulators containing a DNA-binding HTH domain and an aminotransferase domain (MocR family) and their eukaryotic orthologs